MDFKNGKKISAISTLTLHYMYFSSSLANSNVFNGSSLVNLVTHYEKYGAPLKMWMEEGGVVSKAAIPTQDERDALHYDFSKANVISKIVVISECIKDTFAEIDYSSEFLEIGIDHEEKMLTLSTFGHAGDVCISVSLISKRKFLDAGIQDISTRIQVSVTGKN